VVLTSCSHLV